MTIYALDAPAEEAPSIASPAAVDAPPIAFDSSESDELAAAAATLGLPAVAGLTPGQLAEGNINAVTGLATDYLNHFNEAIMVLELIPSMPACIEDLMDWNVTTYREHFLATHQKHRDVVLTAYETADPQAREQLEQVVENMNAILTATRDALRLDLTTTVAAALARDAASMLKPLVARAGAVINGLKVDGDLPLTGVPQAAVDALMRR
jgi:hypothetical protein